MPTLNELKTEYEGLINIPMDAEAASKRSRGYAFERLLNKLFALDNLDPRSGYKPDGEQIDGSIYLDGRVYLLEAKWHADPLPASTLYQLVRPRFRRHLIVSIEDRRIYDQQTFHRRVQG